MKIPYNNFFFGKENNQYENAHHLFTYYQIRNELIKICGKPENDEQHKLLHTAIKRIHNKVPKFKISKEHHNDIHIGEVN